jgi:glycosyltransferase involved in cell wall biosynthesis
LNVRQKNAAGKRTVTVIVPVFDASDRIETLYRGIKSALDSAALKGELVFVDDASTDDTASRLGRLARRDPAVKCIKMRSRFGEAAALDAGLKFSTGRRVVFLSGRVNVEPRAIPSLVKALDAGTDLAVGRRRPRRDSALNRAVSRIFNWMVARIFKVRLHDINSGVFAADRAVLEKVSFYGDLYNFIPIFAAQQGYRIGEEDIEQLPGNFRTSKYPREYVQRFLDMVTVFFLARYSKKPIHFLGFVGTVFIVLGVGILAYLFLYRILQIGGIAGRPLLVFGALFLVIGIQMISIGLLGEMIIFTHAGDIEEYNIEEIIN